MVLDDGPQKLVWHSAGFNAQGFNVDRPQSIAVNKDYFLRADFGGKALEKYILEDALQM